MEEKTKKLWKVIGSALGVISALLGIWAFFFDSGPSRIERELRNLKEAVTSLRVTKDSRAPQTTLTQAVDVAEKTQRTIQEQWKAKIENPQEKIVKKVPSQGVPKAEAVDLSLELNGLDKEATDIQASREELRGLLSELLEISLDHPEADVGEKIKNLTRNDEDLLKRMQEIDRRRAILKESLGKSSSLP